MAEAKKYPTPVTNPETAPVLGSGQGRQVHDQALHRLRRAALLPALDLPVLLLRQDGVGRELPGEATIYTYSLMRKSPTGPYAIAYVTLKEGPSLQTNIVDCDLDEPEDRPEGEGGVEANRRRAAAVLHGGLILPFSPCGRRWRRRLPDEGFYPRALCLRSQPLTQASLLRLPVMPSPTRGEGAAIGTAKKVFGRETKCRSITNSSWP